MRRAKSTRDEVAGILAALGCSVAIIDAKALAAIDPADGAREARDKWDAADAAAEWPDLGALRTTAAGLRKAFEAGPAFVSYGAYDMGPKGLHVEVEKGRADARTKTCEWVAAPFEILGACRDPHGRGWGKYLRWRDGDGRVHVHHVTDAALAGRSRAALRLACRRRLADQSGATTGARWLPFGRARRSARDDRHAHRLARGRRPIGVCPAWHDDRAAWG